MGDDELRRQLVHAAETFPVRGWPLDVQRRVVRRRRITAGLALAVGALATAGVAVGVPMVTASSPGPDGTVPPAFTASADYVGSSWRLTSVAEGANSTAIPTDIGARMDLLPDGHIYMDDGVNSLGGWFTKSADGFEVREVTTTFVAYGGGDPPQMAAIAALRTLAYGSPDGVTPPSPARDKVVSADGTRLVVQAGALRLTFERTGPATDTGPDLPRASWKSS
jgi:hypothetical protein